MSARIFQVAADRINAATALIDRRQLPFYGPEPQADR